MLSITFIHVKQYPTILLTLKRQSCAIFDTWNKICAYRKHVNFAYIYIYIYIYFKATINTLFVVNFIFLSATFVGISYFFLNWREYHSDVATPVILFYCINVSLLHHCEAFQNSFLFVSIFYGRKIINNLSLLTGLSNQQSAGCYNLNP